MTDSYSHDVAKTAPRNDPTRCPHCGSQLIVNLRGWREYTCGCIVQGRQQMVERICPNALKGS